MSVALQNEAAPVTSTGVVASAFYQQPRSYYSLAPSRRPAIAVAQLQQGRGTDLGELDYNLKTAKALGLTIPQTVLLQADQAIQ